MKKLNRKQFIKWGAVTAGIVALGIMGGTVAACANTNTTPGTSSGSGSNVSNSGNYMTSKFNTLDTSMAMGIQPQYIQQFVHTAVQGQQYANAPKYLTPYINFNRNGTHVEDVDFSTVSPATVASWKIYAVAANTTDAPQNFAEPLFVNSQQNSSLHRVQFNETEATDLKSLLSKKIIKTAVLTDRNDVDQWRYSEKNIGSSFVGPQVWNTQTNKAVSVADINSNNTDYDPSNDNVMFNWFNDPYREFSAFAQSFQTNTTYQFSSLPLLKTAVKGVTSTSFENYATNVNNALRAYASSIVNLSLFKNITAQHQTALFVTAPSAGTNATGADNKIYMEQPALFPNYYSSPSNAQLPGFGFSFPAPLATTGSKTKVPFDNWYEIGAASTNGEGSTSLGESLSKSFSGTANYVFYFYDSNLLSASQQQSLLNTIKTWNTQAQTDPQASSVYAVRMLKKGGHIIPLDRNEMYLSSWGPIGTYVQIKNLADILNQYINASDTTTLNTDASLIQKAVAQAKWQPFAASQLSFITPSQTTTVKQAATTIQLQNKISHSVITTAK